MASKELVCPVYEMELHQRIIRLLPGPSIPETIHGIITDWPLTLSCRVDSIWPDEA